MGIGENTMGLDNDITLVTKHRLNLRNIPDYVKIEESNLDEDEKKFKGYHYEICYWRKCWNIRSTILDILDAPQDGGYHIIEKPSQIQEILNNIQYYLEHLNEWDNSIWTADEIMTTLAQDVVNLSWLKKYKKEHPNSIVYFTDSY